MLVLKSSKAVWYSLLILTLGALPNARAEKSAIEFAAIAEPSLPLFIRKSDGLHCAQSRPFQLSARLAVQSQDNRDDTLQSFQAKVERLTRLRLKHFSQSSISVDVVLLRAIFVDALTGNSDALKFLKNQRRPEKFELASKQLQTYEKLCAANANPAALPESLIRPSFTSMTGVLSWVDEKTVTATLVQKLPVANLSVRWPLVPEAGPLETLYEPLGTETQVFLFSEGRVIGSARAVRSDVAQEVELQKISRTQLKQLSERGRHLKTVAVSTQADLRDPDHWHSLNLAGSLILPLRAEIQKLNPQKEFCKEGRWEKSQVGLESSDITVESSGFYSDSLGIWLAAAYPATNAKACGTTPAKPHPATWFQIESGRKITPLRSGIRLLLAADFEKRNHSQWLIETDANPVELLPDLAFGALPNH